MQQQQLEIYNKYYADPARNRHGLFRLLATHYPIRLAIYPGSFVHVVPSFVFPACVYVDNDRQARRFFADPGLVSFIEARKQYQEEPVVRFYPQSYTDELPEKDAGADLLISQYAGFISQHGKRYLRLGGWLVANDSHGDASMASLDQDYRFIAAVIQQDGQYILQADQLECYFVPRQATLVDKTELERTQRGIRYNQPADVYLFQRMS